MVTKAGLFVCSVQVAPEQRREKKKTLKAIKKKQQTEK